MQVCFVSNNRYFINDFIFLFVWLMTYYFIALFFKALSGRAKFIGVYL